MRFGLDLLTLIDSLGNVKANAALLGRHRRSHQLADGIEHHAELGIVFLFQRIQPTGQLGVA
jgi:hypothetical protein